MHKTVGNGALQRLSFMDELKALPPLVREPLAIFVPGRRCGASHYRRLAVQSTSCSPLGLEVYVAGEEVPRSPFTNSHEEKVTAMTGASSSTKAGRLRVRSHCKNKKRNYAVRAAVTPVAADRTTSLATVPRRLSVWKLLSKCAPCAGSSIGRALSLPQATSPLFHTDLTPSSSSMRTLRRAGQPRQGK